MTPWLHNCSVSGKVITLPSRDNRCSLCNTWYQSTTGVGFTASKQTIEKEKQVPAIFKAFRREQDEQ
jgi:hypothetical protein